jgi:membrane associated rhomboid family serine protease
VERRHDGPAYSLLLDTDRPAEVTALTAALRDSSIPFESGLLPGSPPRVLFWVPAEHEAEARRLLSRSGPARRGARSASRLLGTVAPTAPARRALWAAGALVTLHLGIVAWMALLPPGPELLRLAGLVRDALIEQPWRLLSSLFVHSGPRHVLANGLGFAVFVVPLTATLGGARSAWIYLASGIGGGIGAVAFAPSHVTIVGSSGAVAGLFGAWIVVRWRQSRGADFVARHRIRTLGIGLLVLPSLLNPSTASGDPISIGSHVGGMLTGMVIGGLLSLRRAPDPDRPDLDVDEAAEDPPDRTPGPATVDPGSRTPRRY